MKGFLYGQSCYNLQENCIRLDEYVKSAKESGFDFLSITDPNMYASYKFYKLCKENNLKPVIGIEYKYIDEDLKESKVLLYAKTKEGLKNLFKIQTKINKEKSTELNDVLGYMGIAYVFVLDNSYLVRLFNIGDFNKLNNYLKDIKQVDSYIGYSFTNDLSKVRITTEFLDYLYDNDIKVIPVHNIRYLTEEDKIVYKALCDMNNQKVILDDEKDYSFLNEPEETEELDNLIKSIDEDLFSPASKTIPTFPNTKGYESSEYLKGLCHKGLQKRGKYDKAHVDRLNYELSVINKMGYADYFLIVWDFIRYSKQHDILVGPGRGSAAGSLAAYTLGITEVDPLEYDLLFERFLNPERVSMPDIDTDFPDDKRDEVIDYVKNLYGELHVCYITAFNTFQLKSSIRELSKCFNIEQSRCETIIDMVEDKGYQELLNEYRDSALYDFLYVSSRLEDLPKHISTHAAGIIISNDELTDVIPLSEGNNLYQSQYEYQDLEELGLLKMDFLGIRNLSMLKSMMDLVPGFDMAKLRNIPLNDKKVYNLFINADTLGVFQFESNGIRRVLRDIKPTTFNDLVAIIALFRPGPMESIPEYSARKKGKPFTYLHEDLKPILSSTYGIIVYQEQVMLIAQKIAGFSLSLADTMRKAISKKKADLMDKLKVAFINGAKNNGYTEKLAIEIYDLILKFANYGFNKSHAVVYSLLAYQMAYFKANYFYAFMINILNNTIGNTKTMASYIEYAKLRGIKVLPPDINYSASVFIYANNAIYMPFSSIYSIGYKQSNDIVAERNTNGVFKSYENFKKRCNPPTSIIEALIYSGAFDSFGMTKKNLINNKSLEDDIFFKHMNAYNDINDEFDFDTLAKMEYKYLSINLKYNIYHDIDNLRYQYKAIKLIDLRFNYNSKVISSFTKINIIKTKNQTQMAICDISDNTKELKAVIFPKVYEKYKNLLVTNKLLLINGSLKQENEEQSFIINDIAKID